MAFKIDKSSATGYSDEIFSVALRGRHKDNKFASKKEIEFAKNILANQNAIRSSRFASVTRGIKRGSVSRADEELYRKQATIRNASPDLSLVYRINQSLGIGRSRAVSQSDVLSAFTANPYRHKVEEAIRQSALARAASSFSGNEDVVDAQLLERRMQLKNRLRAFHEATQRSGFGRYVEAERQSNREIDEQSEYNKVADRRHRLAESRASIRRKAERIDLAKRYPAFKRFFLDSRNSTKDIHAMAGYLKGMSKIPVVGGIFKANPIAAGSLAAIAAINALLNKQNVANLAATNWENAASFFGAPSKEFEGAARLAGIKDPAKIASIYGQYTKWGLDPAEMMREIGSQTIGRTPFEKQRIAEAYSKSLGVSLGADEIKLAEYLAGDTNISEAREVSAKLGLLETEEQFGFRSGSSLMEKLRSLSLWAPWAKDIEARTGINYVSAGYKYLNPMTAPMFAGYDVADWISAAIADDKYDSDAARNSSPSLPQSFTGSTSNWYGVTIVSDAKSIDELAKDAQRHADAKDERLRAATSQDPGAQ